MSARRSFLPSQGTKRYCATTAKTSRSTLLVALKVGARLSDSSQL
mgnify:CR=1 FL=1